METLGLIPARGGSKGIPNKNIVDLGGKPLIAWTIEAALASNLDRVVVTTEAPHIAEVAREWGAEVIDRPYELSHGDRIFDVECHAINSVDPPPDVFMRLQPTSPFRTSDDINDVLAYFKKDIGAVIGVVEPDRHPYLIVTPDETGRLVHLMGGEVRLPRQMYPTYWAVSGTFWAARTDYFRENRGYWGPKTIGHLMPPDRSLDIDEPADLERARAAA